MEKFLAKTVERPIEDTLNPTAENPRRKMGGETSSDTVANNDNHRHLCDSRRSRLSE
jgi:hypothetical protein